MRKYKIIAALSIAVIAIMLFGFWRAATPPRRLDGWPQGAVWVPHPYLHFSFIPLGVWEGCRFDPITGMDHCTFADYRGKVQYQGDYVTCGDDQNADERKQGVEDEYLTLKPSTSSFIFLQNGTMLVNREACDWRHANDKLKP
jgi:hypothetical protein